MVPATEREFRPRFRRYTPELSSRLTRIAGALGRINGSHVLPATADHLRASAKIGTIHYSTLIEGNELDMVEAERAAEGKLEADTRAKIELVNYVAALDLIDEKADAGQLDITPEFIRELHGVSMKDLGHDDLPFKPHHEGEWRDGRAVVADPISGTIFHEGPPPDEVAPRMAGLCTWIASAETRLDEYQPPAIAGAVHYAITDIHPFADGNGRIARLLPAVILMKHRFLPGRLFSFERYYAADRNAYYESLRSVRRNTLNEEQWLEYFLEGLAQEYEAVAAKIDQLERIGLGATSPVQLTQSQEKGLTKLQLGGTTEFARSDYEGAAGVSPAQAKRDLQRLIQDKMLASRGRGPSTRYRFQARGWEETRGRKRHWTDATIEEELRVFIGSAKWPGRNAFEEAGKLDLYRAAMRNHGIAYWRDRLGLS